MSTPKTEIVMSPEDARDVFLAFGRWPFGGWPFSGL